MEDMKKVSNLKYDNVVFSTTDSCCQAQAPMSGHEESLLAIQAFKVAYRLGASHAYDEGLTEQLLTEHAMRHVETLRRK